jgi:ribosome-associated protein
VNADTTPLSGRALVDAIVDAALAAKAEDIVAYDVRALGCLSDYYLLCTGDVSVHVRAIAQSIMGSLKAHGTHPWCHEGVEQGRWALLDYGDATVHVMLPELREYYLLEELWSKGTRVSV